MANLLDYLDDDDKYPADLILKMCIAHYQFEAIHPFQDGNGRTGRILNLLYLVKKGPAFSTVLYLSKYIIVNKTDYYYNLAGVTQQGHGSLGYSTCSMPSKPPRCCLTN
jgi:Fic family protein